MAYQVELRPIHQVVILAKRLDAIEWSLTGNASSFALIWKPHGPLLAAWHRLTIHFPNGWQSLTLPHLYIDSGDGFNDREKAELRFVDIRKKKATALVFLPRGAKTLRFDPSVTPAHITIGKVALRRIPSVVYYFGITNKLARNRLDDPRQLFRSILCVLRTLVRRGERGLPRRLDEQAALLQQKDYSHWIAEFDKLTIADRLVIKQHIDFLPKIPITVIWSFRAEDIEHIPAALASLANQLHQYWQAIIIAPSTHHLEVAVNAAQGDPRIRVLTTDFSSMLRLEKESVAALLVAGKVVLREHALYLFALEASKGATFVYADEDLLIENGRRSQPFFKPDYSPELAKNTPYFGSCVLVQPFTTDILEVMKDIALGGPDIAHVMENQSPEVFRQVAHIPFVLFSDKENHAQASMQDRALPLTTESLLKVSIIIPTRDREDLIRPCIESILQKTEYPRDRYEIVVVDNGSSQRGALRYLGEIESRRDAIVLRDKGEFNYARLNNRAVEIATGEILVFLNNDTVVEDPMWLHRLVFHAKTPDVGVVGGKLLFPDRTVQHGGVVIGIRGIADHAHRGVKDGGYKNLCNITHEVSAVTAACCAIRRSLFLEIGGFDENLAVAFNDILLCLDALQRGYRNIYIGTALIVHHESKSRGRDDTPKKRALADKECAYTRGKYPAVFKYDRYYNPNLSLAKPYELAFPPRRAKPWRDYQRLNTRKLRILMLSSSHEQGQDVSIIFTQHIKALIDAGHHVSIGGPTGHNEVVYDDCERLIITTAIQAAEVAYNLDIDCVVAYTSSFYSTIRWLGPHIKSIIYYFEEPPLDQFSDVKASHARLRERAFSLSMADSVYSVANSVRDEQEPQNLETSANQLVNTVEILCLSDTTKPSPSSVKNPTSEYDQSTQNSNGNFVRRET